MARQSEDSRHSKYVIRIICEGEKTEPLFLHPYATNYLMKMVVRKNGMSRLSLNLTYQRKSRQWQTEVYTRTKRKELRGKRQTATRSTGTTSSQLDSSFT